MVDPGGGEDRADRQEGGARGGLAGAWRARGIERGAAVASRRRTMVVLQAIGSLAAQAAAA